MKFLCVPCDRPMSLRTTATPAQGTLSVVYSCPDCGYEMAMLTNPLETQLVRSLGVRIGPAEEGAPAGSGGGTCPFAGMVADAGMVAGPGKALDSVAAEGEEVRWTEGARARLANIPSFVRPMATAGIERFARERGRAEVDEATLDEARAFFGM